MLAWEKKLKEDISRRHDTGFSAKWRHVQLKLFSEIQGQIVGAKREGKKMARRKVENGEKSPWWQCFTGPVPNGRGRSGFWLVP